MAKETAKTSKTVELHCEAGNHKWERESQRGRRPINCPEHTVAPEAKPRAEETEEEKLARMERLRQKREEKSAERKAQEAAEQLQKDKGDIERLIVETPLTFEKYDKALTKALKTGDNWREVENLQSSAIGMAARLRYLQAKVGA